MNLPSAAMLKPRSDFESLHSRPREYKPAPRDTTPVKVRIVRGCWVRVIDGAPMRAAKPGEVLQLPRWLADELAANGKASLL